jgi:hypothetical protein
LRAPGDAVLTPTVIIAELENLGYELYPVAERVVHEHKVGPHPMTVITGTRFQSRRRGQGKPPQELLAAAAEWHPYIAALVTAMHPPAAIPWISHTLDSYRCRREFVLDGRHVRFTAMTVAAHLGALCGLTTLEDLEVLEPMIKEVLPR